MSMIIKKPTEIKAHGNKLKIIQEFIGRANSKTEQVSIAKMNSPEGWVEAGQTADFDEYTLVLTGTLRVKTKRETWEVNAGEAFAASKGEWIQYSTPYSEGAEYIAVCIPAFSPKLVNRDDE